MLRVSVCACVCWTKQKVFVKVCRARSLALFISSKNALFALTRLCYRCDSVALWAAAASVVVAFFLYSLLLCLLLLPLCVAATFSLSFVAAIALLVDVYLSLFSIFPLGTGHFKFWKHCERLFILFCI